MRYQFKILVGLFLISSSLVKAQINVDIRKNEFKSGKTGFNDAWKNIKDGDLYFSQGGIWSGRAYNEYLKASAYNNNNPELNYKLGASALFSEHKEEAYEYLSKSMELKPDVADDVLLLAGHSLQYKGRFSEAIELFRKYLDSGVKKSDNDIKLANKFTDECIAAMEVTLDSINVTITNAGTNINSSADDYAEIVTGEEKLLYFASRRGLPKSSKYYSDSKFDENIFVSVIDNGSPGPASLASEVLTTPYCETPVSINTANDSLFIYSGYENGGDIKLSVKKKGKWKLPQDFNPDFNSRDNESSFAVSPSGKEIYFVSNRKQDNLGGKDIYIIRKIDDRKWSDPQNAGPVINSVYDEEALHFSVTGDTLWFSSRGHKSIGGFDIFYTVRNEAGDWVEVKNLGCPVNTPWDDMFFYPSPVDKKLFYFVSNRPGGAGGLDIYTGRLITPEAVVPIEATDMSTH